MASTSSIFGKIFHKRRESTHNASSIYTLVLILSAFVGWGVVYIFDFSFNRNTLVYSLLFALFFITAHVGTIGALGYGSAMLTSLFIGLSLLLPSVWGFFFWNSPVTPLCVLGLLLVGASIFLCSYVKKAGEKSITPRWIFYITLAVVGNAGCTIVQKHQQIDFNGTGGTMLMFFSMLFAAVIYLLIYLKNAGSEDIQPLARSWWAPAITGICNTVLNLCVILLASSELSPNLIYPVLGVGKIAMVTIFSLFIFKEEMSRTQWVGVGIGALAILLLSL